MRLRSNLADRLQAGGLALLLGLLFTWTGWYVVSSGGSLLDWIFAIILFIVGPLCLFVAARSLLFPASIDCPEGLNVLHVRYGLFLLPHRLTLNSLDLEAGLTVGADTALPKSYRRFPVVILRRRDNGEQVYVGFSTSTEKARAALDALARFTNEGTVDRMTATVTLRNGKTVSVSKMATWKGGTQYQWHSELSFPERGVVEIDRTPLARFEKYPFAPAYVTRVKRGPEKLHLLLSDHDEKSLHLSHCGGVQLCRGESQTTRYEFNLVTDATHDNRIHLVSFDRVPHDDSPAELQSLGKQFAKTLGVPLYDHVI